MSTPAVSASRPARHRGPRKTIGAQLDAPHRELIATIIIPVRNEAEGIADTLAALAAQQDFEGRKLGPGRFEVLLLANNCTDDTAAVARVCARRWPRLRLHVLEARFQKCNANVGHARRVLMDLACARLEAAGHPQALIASTDGDSRVAPDWLTALHAEIDAGVDAVGGRIVNGDECHLPGPLARLQRHDLQYQLLRSRLEDLLDPDATDPWPRHHQHFGANFAIKASAYRAVGGLPDVEYLEDEALFAALRGQDLRLRHSCRARVYTSTRLDGRAPVGLSGQLREWQGLLERGQQPRLETATSFRRAVTLKTQLRALWRDRAEGSPARRISAAFARRFELDAAELDRALCGASHFGALWTELEHRWRASARGQRRHQALYQAIAGFRRLVAALATRQPSSPSQRQAATALEENGRMFHPGSSTAARVIPTRYQKLGHSLL